MSFVEEIKEYEDCTYLEVGNPGVPHIVISCDGLQYEGIEGLKERAKELRISCCSLSS